ncbi:MAG: thioredoxin family protein [Flavicella sp.]
MKKIVLLLLLCSTQLTIAQEIPMLHRYSFEEIEGLFLKKPKPIVVFIHTDWCKFCHAMQKNTFSDSEVTSLLNEEFYFISLDGETKEPISFMGTEFTYQPYGSSGTHQIVKELATVDGSISYPTTVFLNKSLNILFQIKGYEGKKEFYKILMKIIDTKKQ